MQQGGTRTILRKELGSLPLTCQKTVSFGTQQVPGNNLLKGHTNSKGVFSLFLWRRRVCDSVASHHDNFTEDVRGPGRLGSLFLSITGPVFEKVIDNM